MAQITQEPTVILAYWDPRNFWLIKEPSHGWTPAPGPGAAARDYSDAQLVAVIRRMYGHQATKGARIVRVASTKETP